MFLGSLSLLLSINSFLTITLILNQNDTSKDSTISQNSQSSFNPIEQFTWICVLIQFIILLIKTKVTDF